MEFFNTNLATVKMVPLEDEKFDIKLRLFGFIPLPLSFVMLGAQQPDFKIQYASIEGETYLWLTVDGFRGSVGLPVAIPVERNKISRMWLERLGTYTVAEGSQSLIKSADLSLDEKSGFLYITVQIDVGPPRSFPIQILSDNQASIVGVGRYAGEIIDALTANTIRYSGLILERN